jgi:hypothetical protein
MATRRTRKREDDVRFLLRLPESLHEELTKLAQEEQRSLNAQIIYLLAKAVRRAPAAE